jgi:mannose-6-phosphate isomerase
MRRTKDLERARQGHARLVGWLNESATPLWSAEGIDAGGAFHEALGQDALAFERPRRASVQARQLFALATARRLGARIDEQSLSAGLIAFMARHVRSDGLVRSMVDPDGEILDDNATLRDQALTLLAMASLRPLLGEAVERAALSLRSSVRLGLSQEGGGFANSLADRERRDSRSHLQLLEACLAWMEVGGDWQWAGLAGEIVALALEHFIDPASGFVAEHFDASRRPLTQSGQGVVQPGRQFEWAWLLLRWSWSAKGRPGAIPARVAALRLINQAETFGVDPVRNAVFDALLNDFSVCDGQARLTSQTARLKAWALVTAQIGGPWWGSVADAIEGLEAHLRTPLGGLWYDRMGLDGSLDAAPASASSFHHIASSIAVLDQAIGETP